MTVDCEGAALLLVGEHLDEVQMISVFACQQEPEDPVDVEDCLETYKELAYRLLTVSGLTG